jgi:hypothetical protein
MTNNIYIYKKRNFKRTGDKMELYENLFDKLLREQFDYSINESYRTNKVLDEEPDQEPLVFEMLLKRYGASILKKHESAYIIKKGAQGVWPMKKDLWYEVREGVNKIDVVALDQYNFNALLADFSTKKIPVGSRIKEQ